MTDHEAQLLTTLIDDVKQLRRRVDLLTIVAAVLAGLTGADLTRVLAMLGGG